MLHISIVYTQIKNAIKNEMINFRVKMVKCTPELIEGAGQYINPVRDRELDLRGYKIPVIENLGSTLDQACLVQY